MDYFDEFAMLIKVALDPKENDIWLEFLRLQTMREEERRLESSKIESEPAPLEKSVPEKFESADWMDINDRIIFGRKNNPSRKRSSPTALKKGLPDWF